MTEKNELAKVICCCGKRCLMVAGNVVAIEATQCWDSNLLSMCDRVEGSFPFYNWNKEALEKVADEINKVHISTNKGE